MYWWTALYILNTLHIFDLMQSKRFHDANLRAEKG